MEKVVVKGDSFSEEIFESVFENEDYESVMSGDFKLNVSKVSFHPTNVPKSSFGIENINSLAMELDSELLESEDFDLDKLSIGLSENLEILEFKVSIQDWNNTMYLPVGTYDRMISLNIRTSLITVLIFFQFQATTSIALHRC